MFFLVVLQILLEHYFPLCLRAVASVLRVFITLCPYLIVKTPVVKLFEKLLKTLRRIAPLYSYQVISFEFCKVFINSQNIVPSLLLQ